MDLYRVKPRVAGRVELARRLGGVVLGRGGAVESYVEAEGGGDLGKLSGGLTFSTTGQHNGCVG